MFEDDFYRKLVLLLETEEIEKSAEELTEADAALLQEWMDHWQTLQKSSDEEAA